MESTNTLKRRSRGPFFDTTVSNVERTWSFAASPIAWTATYTIIQHLPSNPYAPFPPYWEIIKVNILPPKSTSFMKLKLCSCIHPTVEVLIYWRMWSFKNLLLPEVQHCQHLKQPPETSQDPRQEAHSWSCHLHRPGLPSTTKSCSQWRTSCNQKL